MKHHVAIQRAGKWMERWVLLPQLYQPSLSISIIHSHQKKNNNAQTLSLPFLTSCLKKKTNHHPTPPRVNTFQTFRALAFLAGFKQITAKMMRQLCSQMCHHAWKSLWSASSAVRKGWPLLPYFILFYF